MLVILLSFLYMFAYVAVTAPLEFTMIAVALLWRNDQWRRGQAGCGSAARRIAADRRRRWTDRAAAAAGCRAGCPAVRLRPSVVRPAAPADQPGGRAAEGGGQGQPAQPGRGRVAGLSLVVMTVVITSSFSTAAAGAFFTAMSLFLIVEAVVTLGAATGTTYFIARLRSLGSTTAFPR